MWSPTPNFNDNNNVLVPLKNGQNQLVAFDTGLHPWRNQVMPGPWLTNLTASVYKNIPITERVTLRINLDAFNVLNQPGLNLPGGDGIISLRTSAQGRPHHAVHRPVDLVSYAPTLKSNNRMGMAT